jgi:hypothetical protein
MQDLVAPVAMGSEISRIKSIEFQEEFFHTSGFLKLYAKDSG